MSHPNQNSRRLFVRGGLLLLVLCGLVAGGWQAGWLPAGMSVTLDHFAASIRSKVGGSKTSENQIEIADGLSPAERAEQEMLQAGEQSEPVASPQDRPARVIPDPQDEPPANADAADTEIVRASRQRLADRLGAQQTGSETDAGSSNQPPRDSASPDVIRADLEEDFPADSPPLAAAKRDPSKPAPASPPGKVPFPRENEGNPLSASPARTSKASPPNEPESDRPASNSVGSNAAANVPGAASASKAALMDMNAIEELIAANDYVTAQRELSRWYWKKPGSRNQIRQQLEEMAQALYFAPQPQFHEPYVVQAGDQLRVIAQRYKLSWEYISKLNHVEARKIRMGQKLKVVDGPFSAIISLGGYELIVHLNGSFVRSYRVGVGKEGTTPLGTFTVKNKMVDPTYYGPDGLVLAHDDPKNPLGERWIDIGDSYGIHGTIDPGSIGKNESRGCIRMLNADVEELYDLLVIGATVKIQK